MNNRRLLLAVIAIAWIELMNNANENIGWCITASARFGADKKSITTKTWLGDGSTSGGSQNVFSEVLNHANLNTDADMWISPRLSNANVADVFKFVGFGLWLES